MIIDPDGVNRVQVHSDCVLIWSLFALIYMRCDVSLAWWNASLRVYSMHIGMKLYDNGGNKGHDYNSW